MSGFVSPNYTQTPNDLFDELLPEMGLAELKVVMCIIRHTFGYHKETVKLSIRSIARFTGLTAVSVMDGATQAEAHGLIERYQDGNKTTLWKAIVSVIPTITRRNTRYNADVIPTKTQLGVKESNKKNNKDNDRFKQIVLKVSELRGGAITPMDAELIDYWIPKHTDYWIEEALRRTKAKGARSAQYTDTILQGWEANGYPKTREEKVQERKVSRVEKNVDVIQSWLSKQEAINVQSD